MPKEILLYNYYLSNYSVEALIEKLEAAIDDDVTLRVNCFGGEVFAAWGLFAKVKEHGSVSMKVDGVAASGAGNLLLYAKYVECLSVSRVMLHRANASVETESEKAFLNSVNVDLRKQLEMKVDADKFKTVTGYTIEQMFNPETRIDIWLNASQLKKLGLVSKVTQLTPTQEKEMASATAELELQFAQKIAASLEGNPTSENKDKSKNTDMTIEKLKAEFPAVYAAIVAEAKKAGQEAEQARVKAWLAFAKIDAEAVQKGITEGKEMSIEVIAEFTGKAASAQALKNAEDDSAKGIKTEEQSAGTAGATVKAKELASFMNEVNKQLGRKTATA